MGVELRGPSGMTVLITGAGREQGANHARASADAGCDVIAAVETALAEFGGIDILVNNAGMAALDTIQDMSASTLDSIIDTNSAGPGRVRSGG